ncbi:MAG: flagellar FlbD family protein [Clostridiales bacterium]|nr:flagellar FlbD family protein [Clostridiales bacterium]
MIVLTQLNGDPIYVNFATIEYIEEVPHTIITTLSNNRIIVKETARQIIEQGLALRDRTSDINRGA